MINPILGPTQAKLLAVFPDATTWLYTWEVECACETGVDPSTVRQTLHKLEQKGYLEKHMGPGVDRWGTRHPRCLRWRLADGGGE